MYLGAAPAASKMADLLLELHDLFWLAAGLHCADDLVECGDLLQVPEQFHEEHCVAYVRQSVSVPHRHECLLEPQLLVRRFVGREKPHVEPFKYGVWDFQRHYRRVYFHVQKRRSTKALERLLVPSEEEQF